jgi:hypothetical protein
MGGLGGGGTTEETWRDSLLLTIEACVQPLQPCVSAVLKQASKAQAVLKQASKQQGASHSFSRALALV